MSGIERENIGCLRDMSDDDLEQVLAWRNAPNVRANMYSQHEIKIADHLKWWAKTKESDSDRYFIFEHDGAPTGVVSFNMIDPKSRNAFWAFYASSDAPKGTGSRMEILALEYAFGVLDLHKLCCEVLDFNTPVVALHKKFGFEEEGFFKDQRRVGDNFASVHRLAIASTRWDTLRSDFISRFDPKATT